MRRSLEPLGEFPLLGQELTGCWKSLRFVLDPWRWMLLVHEHLEEEDRVMVVTIHDTRTSARDEGDIGMDPGSETWAIRATRYRPADVGGTRDGMGCRIYLPPPSVSTAERDLLLEARRPRHRDAAVLEADAPAPILRAARRRAVAA